MRDDSRFTMSKELSEYVKGMPVNRIGYYVVPCRGLVFENMEPWMKGLSVTFSLTTPPSSQGTIEKWDEKWLYIKVGASVKKMKYDPQDIQLACQQFKQGILFSNEMFTTHQKKKEPEDVVEEKEEMPRPVVKKTKKQSTSKKTTTSYVPKNGIVWS